MSRCPVCQSVRIVLVLSPERQSFCAQCGARWIQDGSEQRNVTRADGVATIRTVEDQPA